MKYQAAALEEMAAEKEQALVTQFPLLQADEEQESSEVATPPVEPTADVVPAAEENLPGTSAPSTLDELFGTSSPDENTPEE